MVTSSLKSAAAAARSIRRAKPAGSQTLTFERISRDQGKRERTRSLMLDATARLVAYRDPGDFAICDITNGAGVANGTFYYHFSDKAEIIAETAHRIAKHLGARIYKVGDDIADPAERISAGLHRFVYFCVDHPTWARALGRSVNFLPDVREQVYRHMSRTIRRGIEEGDFDVADKDLTYDLMLSAAFTAARAGLEGMDPYEAAAAMSEMQLRALGVTKKKAKRASQIRLQPLRMQLDEVDNSLSEKELHDLKP